MEKNDEFLTRDDVIDCYKSIIDDEEILKKMVENDNNRIENYKEDIVDDDFDRMWFNRLHDTGLRSKKGIKIFMTLIPFHDFLLCNAKDDCIYSKGFLLETSGGFCFIVRDVQLTKETKDGGKTYDDPEDIYTIIINYDMYRVLCDYGDEDVALQLISHEIGHCLNDDSYESSPRTIERETRADITGLDLIRECCKTEKNFFTGFAAFNPKTVFENTGNWMTTGCRGIQHIVNWMTAVFGYENLYLAMEHCNVGLISFAKNFLDTNFYMDGEWWNDEDTIRFRNIRKYLESKGLLNWRQNAKSA